MPNKESSLPLGGDSPNSVKVYNNYYIYIYINKLIYLHIHRT